MSSRQATAENDAMTEPELEDGAVYQAELATSPSGEFINVEEVDLDENAFTEGACEFMQGQAQTGPARLCDFPEAGRMLRIELSGSMVVHVAAGKPLVVRFAPLND